ncbi:hypothetical protein [Demequina sp.]|uniref:hypothetical protein n=1 Tax=Demequina sp. TaxID=2050685 RepID=UPI003D10C137
MSDTRDTAKRKYYASFEAALADSNVPLENVDIARQVAAAIPHDTVYIPQQTKAYVALRTASERRLSATILAGHAWVRSDLAPLLGDLAEHQGNWWGVPFPVRREVERGSARGAVSLAAPVCGDCFVQLPVTGICDNCDG